MTPLQAMMKLSLQNLLDEHPAAPMAFALMAADPDHQPSGDLLRKMTDLDLAENGKVRAEVRELL